MAITNKDKKFYSERSERQTKKEAQLKKLLLSGYVSCSSNSKWLKIFEDLSAIYSSEITVLVKPIEQEEFEYKNFFSSFFESGYLEGIQGTYSYQEIEWVLLPTTSSLTFEYQVDFESTEHGIKIYGYRKQKA